MLSNYNNLCDAVMVLLALDPGRDSPDTMSFGALDIQ